jgi:16S rRNA (guanine527-N7)-methyltransferase
MIPFAMVERPEGGWPIASVLKPVAAELDVDETALSTWLDVLIEWNAKIDLTAAKTPRALVWLMCADAWMLSRAVPHRASVIDVGTGAGAPGLALAIMRPDLRVTLVEPLGKRAAFLRTVIGKLGRTDVALVAQTDDQLKDAQFDVAVSRATFSPKEWLERARELVRAGGGVWVFLAREPAPSAEGASAVETLTYTDEAGIPKQLVRYEIAR